MRLPWGDCVFPGCDAASRWNIPSCKGKRPEDRKLKRIEDLKKMRKRIEDLRKALAASKQKHSSMEHVAKSVAEALKAHIEDSKKMRKRIEDSRKALAASKQKHSSMEHVANHTAKALKAHIDHLKPLEDRKLKRIE